MNKQEVIKKKEELQKEISMLDEIINKPARTKEEVFLELINGCEIKIDKEEYPDSIFFLKDGKYMLEIEKTYLRVSYFNIWSVFESEFSMSYNQIQSFVQEWVEEHFKMKGLTPNT